MKCKARNAAGKPCRMNAVKGGKYCFTHSPDTRAQQAEARKRGGFNHATPHAGNLEAVNKAPRTIEEALTILDYTLAEALAADNGDKRNRALIALADSYLKALDPARNEDLYNRLMSEVSELRKQVNDRLNSDLDNKSVPMSEAGNEKQ